jgi:RNA recognition motif-containing protein
LPYSIESREIASFFKDFRIIRSSMKFQHFEDGSRNGYAALLFETPEEAEKAMAAKQGGKIGYRYIEV